MATSRANNLPDFEIQTRGRAMPIEGETLGDSADAFVGVCPEVVTLIDDSNASSQALCPDANAQAGGAPSPIAFEHPSGDAGAFGKFRLGAELGRGGMGIVYRAFDTIVRREVALKLLASNQSQQVRTRFLLEAEAAGRLVHPHVCRVYECGEVEGRLFISMELVDGCPADEHVREEGLSVRQIGRLTARICNAIGFAHGEGVVHRDLKPHNILVDRRMATPKIMDFGIARVQGAGRAPQTAAGTVLGTPAYMSPEQAMGTSDLGPTTDVWSLGVLLYRLLAGNLPFE
ncbi:MAG: serine/threonine-protein kinase, partial [Planctomycetota bacterium]